MPNPNRRRGAPALPPGEHRRPITIRVAPDIADAIDAIPHGSKTAVLEPMLRAGLLGGA